MASTLPHPAPGVHSARVGPVARDLARRLGLTEGSAHQVLHGPLAERCAAVVESFYAAGDLDGLTRWTAPITAALDRTPAVTVTADIIVSAQESDAAEEIAEARFCTTPSAGTARGWVRGLLRQAGDSLQLARGLADRWNFTL